MDAEQVKVLGDRAQRFTKIRELPGWNDLKTIYEARRRNVEKVWTRQLWNGETPTDLEYQRGFLDGINYLITAVDHADETFEKALKRA